MAAEDYAKLSDSEKKKEDWMNSKWRPMMGWMYMAVCACDFMVFPVLWSGLQAALHVAQMTQWQPLTLQGAGLFHIAMGAVLGIAAYGRTQEKLNGANNGGLQPTSQSVTTTFSAPSAGFSAPTGGFGAPAAPASSSGSGFGSTPPAPAAGGFGSSSGFGAPATPGPIVSSSGKLGPAPQQDPVL